MQATLDIQLLRSLSIRKYIPSIAKLRLKIFKDHPLFYKGNLDTEIQYLEHFALSKEAVMVAVFEDHELIGVSSGIPLSETTPQLQKPFIEEGLPLAEYFSFGESMILPPYRGRGIGHHFFDLREEHVRHLKRYSHICFSDFSQFTETKDYFSLEGFWKKRGYVKHPSLKCHTYWEEPSIQETTPPPFAIWIKDLLR